MNKLNSNLKLQNHLPKPKHKQHIMVKHDIAIDHKNIHDHTAYTLIGSLNMIRQRRCCLNYSNCGDYQILFIGEEEKNTAY